MRIQWHFGATWFRLQFRRCCQPAVWLVLLLCAGTAAAQTTTTAAKAAPLPAKDYAVEFHPALKDDAKAIPELLRYGPDASECVKFAAEGLRITVPLGYPKMRPATGVVTDFGVQGDFEMTVAYEILLGKTADPMPNFANLRLMAVPNERPEPDVWHKATQNRGNMVREIIGRNGVGRFFANAAKWNPLLPKDKWGNEDFSKIEKVIGKRIPATSLKGRLRLVRRGGDLFFFASDSLDGDFQLIQQSDFGTKDLKNVRVVGSTGTAGDALDTLVTDLHIRADAFVKAGAATAPPQPGASEPRSLLRPILIAASVLLLLILLILAVLWFYLRQRRRDAGAAPTQSSAATLAFTCSHCHKRMKTKADRAGKTLKCPHCSKIVKVPDEAEEVS